MNKEIVVMDNSISRLNARTLLDKGLYFAGFLEDKEMWGTHSKDSAKKYASVQEAINDANKLKNIYPEQKPPHVFEITMNGNIINLNDIKY